MKKVFDGAVYNTQTAKIICEQTTEDFEHTKGTDVKKNKQLFKTRSNKYFFFIKNEFNGYVDKHNNDIDPVLKETELEEKKIVPVSYELACQFASEVISREPKSKEIIGKYFPELMTNQENGSLKIQKKIYLSEKANWYLEMMLIEKSDTNSNMIEKLILSEYQRLYSEGTMVRDPYSEMDD